MPSHPSSAWCTPSLLKPFDFPHPEKLAILRETSVVLGNAPGPDNYTHFENWKANAKTLADAALFQNGAYSIGNGSDHPAVVHGLSVTPGFFHTLGVSPLLGRSFLPADALEHSAPVVVLSWSAWQQYFNGDPSVIGKTLRSGGIPQTVIGVLPRGFHFPYMNEMWGALPPRDIAPYEIYTPFVAGSGTKTSYDYNFDFLVVARLRAGVSLPQAGAELNSLQADFVHAHRLSDPIGAVVEPLQREVTGDYSTALWVLLAAVSSVLLIGCAQPRQSAAGPRGRPRARARPPRRARRRPRPHALDHALRKPHPCRRGRRARRPARLCCHPRAGRRRALQRSPS